MAFTKQELERMIQDLQEQADSLVREGEYKLADKRIKAIKDLKEQLKYLKDCETMLELSGLKSKDDDATNKINLSEPLGQEKGQEDSCGKVFTKGAEDGGPGSGIKGHTTPEEEKAGSSKSGEVEYDEEEIKEIKEKWSGKESEYGYGSEYGDILNHLVHKATKSGKLPDMNKYYDLSDKLLKMREEGKKGSEEYKAVEKERNDFNKAYNKVHKSLKEKAKSLSSEGEQKRLAEVEEFAKKRKSSDGGPSSGIKGTEDKNPDWNVGNFSWDVGIFNGQWYITKNGQKFKGPFSSMKAAERYLDGHKWELEYKSGTAKDSDPKLNEAQNLINLFGGVK